MSVKILGYLTLFFYGNGDGGYMVVIIAFGNKCYVLNKAKVIRCLLRGNLGMSLCGGGTL